MTLTNAGSGYGSTPTVTICGHRRRIGPAVVVPTMSGGSVTGFTIFAAGSGYSGTVTATLTGGSPSVAATATPVVWNTTWSSPNVYLANPGTGTSTAVVPDSNWLGYGKSSSSGGPYLIPAPTPGYTNQYQAPVGGIFVAECVTTSPHCLKTGQTLSITGTATIYASVGKTAAAAVTAASYLNRAECLVWVTGPNTFVTVLQGPITDAGYGMPGHFNNVAGSFAVDYVATIFVPDQGAMPYSVLASMVGDLPGTNLWINLPPGVTDAWRGHHLRGSPRQFSRWPQGLHRIWERALQPSIRVHDILPKHGRVGGVEQPGVDGRSSLYRASRPVARNRDDGLQPNRRQWQQQSRERDRSRVRLVARQAGNHIQRSRLRQLPRNPDRCGLYCTIFRSVH